MALEPSQVKHYYDRFGRKQDSQGFYEDPPIERMIEHADFGQARSIFELGCGTGRLAHRLLSDFLPADASYLGIDLSDTMVKLATEHLAPFGARAVVNLSDGGVQIPVADQSVDRVVAVYVLDLLPEEEIAGLFAEARRVLAPGGRFCAVSLGEAAHLGAKIVGGLWSTVYRVAPMLVGGCRPIALSNYLGAPGWKLVHRELLAPYGVPSEVIIATPIGE